MKSAAQSYSSRLLGRDWPWLAAVLLVALVAAWPAISQPGLLNTRGGGDSPFLLQRLHQMTAALADGHFPVRWMPDANYGYGYPFYNYYAPLSIYIAAAFRFLGFSFVRAIHLAQLAGFVVAGLGLFVMLSWLLARLLGPRPLPVDAPADTASDTSTLPSLPQAPRAAPKLARRARATR